METKKTIKKILIATVMAIIEFAFTHTQAQDFHRRNYARGSSKPIVALTVGLGIRSPLIKSDLEYINNMKASLEGWESSLMFGGNNVRVRTGFGLFKTEMSNVNSIKQASISGLVNMYVPGMTKNFRPYAITGLDVNTFTFTGSFVPKSPLMLLLQSLPCTCQSTPPGGLLPPPPNPEDTQAATIEKTSPEAPEINTAKMTSTQLVGGLGSEFNFQLDGRFFSMFGEMRYGLPIGVTTQKASLNETKTKNNIALAFGVAIGLNGKRRANKIGIR